MNSWVIILGSSTNAGTQARALACRFVSPSRIVTVGAAGSLHRSGGVQVERPLDRGTTPDVLLGLLQVLARDLGASVVILRASARLPGGFDLEEAVNAGLLACDEGGAGALLIATEDTAAPTDAAELDGSVIVANAWTLANLVHERAPDWFRALRRVVWSPEEMDDAFECLAPSDLLKDVLLPSAGALHVVPALRTWPSTPIWQSRQPLEAK